VLFADGRHYGDFFEKLEGLFYNFRSFARDLQYRQPAERRATLERTSKLIESLQSVAPASRDFQSMQDQEELAKTFLFLPESDLEAAINRVASLPDVVKGK